MRLRRALRRGGLGRGPAFPRALAEPVLAFFADLAAYDRTKSATFGPTGPARLPAAASRGGTRPRPAPTPLSTLLTNDLVKAAARALPGGHSGVSPQDRCRPTRTAPLSRNGRQRR